jgi:hypothetical protein
VDLIIPTDGAMKLTQHQTISSFSEGCVLLLGFFYFAVSFSLIVAPDFLLSSFFSSLRRFFYIVLIHSTVRIPLFAPSVRLCPVYFKLLTVQ